MSKNDFVRLTENDFGMYLKSILCYEYIRKYSSEEHQKMFDVIESVAEETVSNFGVWFTVEDRNQIFAEFEKDTLKQLKEKFGK